MDALLLQKKYYPKNVMYKAAIVGTQISASKIKFMSNSFETAENLPVMPAEDVDSSQMEKEQWKLITTWTKR